jgi:hypothetical protein
MTGALTRDPVLFLPHPRLPGLQGLPGPRGQRVSAENLRLLERQHLFLLDASHELGTPLQAR